MFFGLLVVLCKSRLASSSKELLALEPPLKCSACRVLCPRHLSWQQETICLNRILGKTIPEMKVSVVAQ